LVFPLQPREDRITLGEGHHFPEKEWDIPFRETT
jgi:hypothetical protein